MLYKVAAGFEKHDKTFQTLADQIVDGLMFTRGSQLYLHL